VNRALLISVSFYGAEIMCLSDIENLASVVDKEDELSAFWTHKSLTLVDF